MTYQQLNLNYINAMASHTPNWADPCGIACNPCDSCPTLGTCGGPCNTGAFSFCNGSFWMNPSTTIIDAAAVPPPPPEPCAEPCAVTCCKKKKCCRKNKCGKKKCCVKEKCCTYPSLQGNGINIDYFGGCAPICIDPCPPPCIPLVPLIPLDPCLNPWVKNLSWLQRTYAGRYEVLHRV